MNPAGPRGPAADDLFNPYRAPETPAVPAKGAAEEELSILSHWERLRVAYNLILAAEVLILALGALPAGRRLVNFLTILPVYAFLANLCFCAGPVATAYARWIGLRPRPASFVLFGLGTLLAVLITAMVVIVNLYPLMMID